jgi:hypothetical protein
LLLPWWSVGFGSDVNDDLPGCGAGLDGAVGLFETGERERPGIQARRQLTRVCEFTRRAQRLTVTLTSVSGERLTAVNESSSVDPPTVSNTTSKPWPSVRSSTYSATVAFV